MIPKGVIIKEVDCILFEKAIVLFYNKNFIYLKKDKSLYFFRFLFGVFAIERYETQKISKIELILNLHLFQ